MGWEEAFLLLLPRHTKEQASFSELGNQKAKLQTKKEKQKRNGREKKKETLNTPQRLTVVINVPKTPLLMAGWEAGRVV